MIDATPPETFNMPSRYADPGTGATATPDFIRVGNAKCWLPMVAYDKAPGAYRYGFKPTKADGLAIHPAISEPKRKGWYWLKWSEYEDRNPTPKELRRWSSTQLTLDPPGMCCLMKGAEFGLDCDIDHAVISRLCEEIVERELGYSPYVRRRGTRMMIMFCLADRQSLKRRSTAKYIFDGIENQIEIKDAGKIVALYGKHRKGLCYRWTDKEYVYAKPDDIPIITAEQLEATLGACEKAMLALGAVAKTKPAQARGSEPLDPDRNLLAPSLHRLKSAVSAIVNDQDWQDRLPIIGAIKRSGSSFDQNEVRALAHLYSAKFDRYDPIETDGLFDSLDLIAPNLAGFGTIVTLARKAGWVNPDTLEDRSMDFDALTLGDQILLARLAKWDDPLDVFVTTLDGLAIIDPPRGCAPALIEAFARDTAKRFGGGVAAAVASCVAVAGAACSDDFRIQPLRFDTSYTETPRIWMLILGSPGSGKTPIIGAAVAPLKTVEYGYLAEDAAASEAYELEAKVYAELENRYVKGKTATIPVAPVKPPKRRKIVNDATVEVLSDILRDNPSGLLSHNDELAGLIGSFDAYKSGKGADRQNWLELYNGGPRTIDRVNRGTISVPNWGASIIGGMQPEVLRGMAAKLYEDGFMQRFLCVSCDQSGVAVDRKPSFYAVEGYKNLIKDLCALKPEFAQQPFRLAEDAQQYRERVAQVKEALLILPDSTPSLQGFANKLNAFFARLVLIFHLCESCDFMASGAPAAEIPTETAERAYTFLIRVVLPHTVAVHQDILRKSSSEADHTRSVAGHLLAHRLTEITARNLGRACHAMRDDEVRRKTMAALVAMGWCRLAEGGRADQTKWLVNPLAHFQFSERAEQERVAREAITAKIKKGASVLARLHE